MMNNDDSWQSTNAKNQRDEIKKRILIARREIRRQIKASYDPDSGRHRYLVNKNGNIVEKKRFYESDFLKYSCIDKNTLKRDYHHTSRKMVSRLVIWVNAKISDDKPRATANSPVDSASEGRTPFHAIVASERDAIAEKFGILELQLSEALREKRIIENKLDEALADLKNTRDSVASLTNLLLKVGSDHKANVVSLVDRDP